MDAMRKTEKEGSMKVVQFQEGESFDIELEEDLLKRNREIARTNERLLEKHGIQAIDVMGSIGSGKTTLIEHLSARLAGSMTVGVVAGDLTTTIDADRIVRHGARVVEVNTGKECHLDANLVGKALRSLPLEELNVLFVENVGNLICPAEFPLGARKRVVVVSVTEGPHMVVKHPYIFGDATAVVINKVELAEAMGVDPEQLTADVAGVNPDARVIRASLKDDVGTDEVLQALGLAAPPGAR
jgi:hydrogenase nickel incorporation protein HypB